jgi:hypothetical protein
MERKKEEESLSLNHNTFWLTEFILINLESNINYNYHLCFIHFIVDVYLFNVVIVSLLKLLYIITGQ